MSAPARQKGQAACSRKGSHYAETIPWGSAGVRSLDAPEEKPR